MKKLLFLGALCIAMGTLANVAVMERSIPASAQAVKQSGWYPPTADALSHLKRFTYNVMGVYPTEIVISESITQNNIETTIQNKYLKCPKGTYVSSLKKGIPPVLLKPVCYGAACAFAGMACYSRSPMVAVAPGLFSSIFFKVGYSVEEPGRTAQRLISPIPANADPNYDYFLLSSESKIHSIK